MTSKVVKSTSKGQITLPKIWRSQFDTDYFVLEPGLRCIVIKPLNFNFKKTKEEVIFDAKTDNDGKGVSIDEMIKMSAEVQREEKEVNKKSKRTQKKIIEDLYGAWPIDETADDLIARIKGMRKNSKIISINDD